MCVPRRTLTDIEFGECFTNVGWAKWDIALHSDGTFTNSGERGMEFAGSLQAGAKVTTSQSKAKNERWTKWQAWRLVKV